MNLFVKPCAWNHDLGTTASSATSTSAEYYLLSRERYYQKVMEINYLLFYDRFILIIYENCNEFYDYI